MKIDVGQLPDAWHPAAQLAVASWRDSFERLEVTVVGFTPLRGAAGATVPHLMHMEAHDATGKVVFATDVLVAGREVINHVPTKVSAYLAGKGFPRTPMDPVLVAHVLRVSDALPAAWRDPQVAQTATLDGPVLTLTRDGKRLDVTFTDHAAFTATEH
jgi:hypothetical protein